MVRTSIIELTFVIGDFKQPFDGRLRQAKTVRSRVLDCFGSLRHISICDWSKWFLRQQYFAMNL